MDFTPKLMVVTLWLWSDDAFYPRAKGLRLLILKIDVFFDKLLTILNFLKHQPLRF